MQFSLVFKSLNSLLLVFMFILFPSCVKYYELSKSEFPQGKEKEFDKKVVINSLQCKKIYDQFATKAIFDVLYMSDELRTLSTVLYCAQHGKDNNFKSAMLRRQLEENRHWVSFYILSWMPNDLDKQLNDKEATWGMYLEFEDGTKVSPVSIREVDDLPAEIRFYYGYRVSDYKTPYLVKFPARDGDKLYLKNKPNFKLIMSTVDKECVFKWKWKDDMFTIDEKKKSKNSRAKWQGRHEDYYWV